jgi:hypothetical protein
LLHRFAILRSSPDEQACWLNMPTSSSADRFPRKARVRPRRTRRLCRHADRGESRCRSNSRQTSKIAGEKLNWRKPIVDAVKLLDLDSSAKVRKALADELKYTGDKSNSETNIWFHGPAKAERGENGGVVPKGQQD